MCTFKSENLNKSISILALNYNILITAGKDNKLKLLSYKDYRLHLIQELEPKQNSMPIWSLCKL